MSVGDLLDGTVRTILRNWKTVFGVAAVVFIPFNIVYFGLGVDPGAMPLEEFTDPVEPGQDPTQIVSPAELGATFMLALVQTIVISPFIAGAVVYLIGRDQVGQDTGGIGAALGAAARRLHVLVGARVLLALVGLILGLLLVLFFGVLVGVGGLVGGLLLIPLVPAAIFGLAALYVLFAIVTPAVMLEGRGPLSALGRSSELVRRRYWPTLGRVLLLVLLYWVLTLVLSPLQFVGMFTGAAGSAIVMTVTEVLVTPFLPVALTLVYLDLRARTEGTDLAASYGGGPPRPWWEQPGSAGGWGAHGQQGYGPPSGQQGYAPPSGEQGSGSSPGQQGQGWGRRPPGESGGPSGDPRGGGSG
ncbi:hypothetical protein ER308_17560 [Egibacter rhizosphaerae]|uniref:Glycerophosphoryl diester phosphodiesterase membrane domain-containing protein n=1 Tax=Egibacter rhizosphaerae TaxID=1670831 RepID=A0A411YJ22_9ACTN|nr:hypothetical protein [Egibacter rhizosphaerae]QBI21197.1 hypothetical protein ER308_17560 [Egibacter rhizosphaerae]